MPTNKSQQSPPSHAWIWALGALVLGGTIALILLWRGPAEAPILSSADENHSSTPPAAQPTPPPPADLPVAVPAHAPGLAGFLDPETDQRLPADFEALVPAVTEPEEIDAVVALLRDRDEPENLRNEAINLLRRSQHPGLVAELLAVLDDDAESERFRGFVAQHLGISLHEGDDNGAAITHRLRRALHDRHLDVRRETLRALERVADPEAIALLAGGLAPQAPDDVRDLVIRAAHRADRRDLAPDIRPYLTSEDPVIRIAAIYVLGQWRDDASRPELIAALRDTDPRVAGAAEVALAHFGPAGE